MQKNKNHNIRLAFLTLFFSGLSKYAPGTVGTFVSLLLGMALLQFFDSFTLLLLSILITLVAIKQINIYESYSKTHDSGIIVIDELVGMWLTMAFMDIQANQWDVAILAFVLFRIFDITKPSIIKKVDQNVKGGLGVMLDDILAGFFAAIAGWLILRVIATF